MNTRVFLIVLDSFGIGSLPDAARYGDENSHTLRSIASSEKFRADVLQNLGLFQIQGAEQKDGSFQKAAAPLAAYGTGKLQD